MGQWLFWVNVVGATLNTALFLHTGWKLWRQMRAERQAPREPMRFLTQEMVDRANANMMLAEMHRQRKDLEDRGLWDAAKRSVWPWEDN